MEPSISAVGATIQSVGVLVLAALSSLIARTLGAVYLRTWAVGWWALGAALTALQLSFWFEGTVHWLQPIYHLGSFTFVFLLARGALERAGRNAAPVPAGLVAGAVALSIAFPWTSPVFTTRFIFHAAIVAAGFAWACAAMLRARVEGEEPLGRGIAVAALALLAVDFGLYPVTFGWAALRGLELPPFYAQFTSLYDLLLEVVLAMGLVATAFQDASSQIRALRGLLPICAWCRKLRDDQGYWKDLETWSRASRDVTHGICPDCRARHFPDPA